MLARMLLLVGLSGLFGCGQDDLVTVPGTTVRVAPPTAGASGKGTLDLHIFHTEDECYAAVGPDDAHLCMPYVDRASGQVRVAFQVQVEGEPWPVPLAQESIDIVHKGFQIDVSNVGGPNRIEIIPHKPSRAPQLFVLLIDGSGSMAYVDDASGRTRMDKLKAALLRADVVDAFFPTEVQTAVVPLVFRGAGNPEPLGGKWIVDNKQDYRKVVRENLQIGAGYTFLYRAVEWSTSSLLEVPEVRQAIDNRKQVPTIIALTDGFNNEDPADQCKTNAGRLERLLGHLSGVRRGETVDVRKRPVVYTVGLGKRAWRDFQVQDDLKVAVPVLCKGLGERRIDGDIENRGVDNAALSWIARIGGGEAYIKQDTEGLAQAFRGAAATRFEWFEARYQVDPFHLRRAFETRLRLNSLLRSEAAIWIHPSGWMDAPPGVLDDKQWAHAVPFGVTTTLVLPVLGLLVAMGYVPAAVFNVRRALFSRVARKRRTR